jgi:hypothetical protein
VGRWGIDMLTQNSSKGNSDINLNFVFLKSGLMNLDIYITKQGLHSPKLDE